MKSDYVPVSDPALTETEFVEQYWTDNWIDHGGVENRAERAGAIGRRFALKTEWRIMRRHLKTLPSDALLVDGGCGVGEW